MVLDGRQRLLDGKYFSFYENGNKKSEGFYKNNQPTGFWNYYYEGGKLRMRGQLKGKSNFGLWKYYYENGQVSMEGEIYDGKREGPWKLYFENGKEKSSGTFEKGAKTGLWNHFYEDGNIKAQVFYKGKLGFYREFYSIGKAKLEGYQINGKSDSTWTYFHENGAIEAKGRFKDGRRNGIWTYYFENGNISAEGQYLNGDKNGKWTYYHENGQKSSEGEEKQGKREGQWKIYDNEGYLKGEGNFQSGTGDYKEFYDNGNLKVSGKMIDGVHDGEWLYYYDDGILEGKCLFVDGKGEYIGYYPNGEMRMKGKIEYGKNVGNWELFKEDGSIAGYYKPIYENEEPVFRLDEQTKTQSEARGNGKPDYRYKKRYNRYFTPRINEFRGFIIATNPLAMLIGSLPISLEHYYQERLGHEVQLSILRDPFFKNDDDIDPYKIYKRGFDIAIRQKFYHNDKGIGMFYFANELRYTYVKNYINAVDSTGTSSEYSQVSSTENIIQYAFLVGSRWLHIFGESWNRKSNKNGISVDIFVGAGIGYRNYSKNYDDHLYYDQFFDDLKQSKLVVSPRFGVNIGYVF